MWRALLITSVMGVVYTCTASAAVIDLTSGTGSYGWVNGALIEFGNGKGGTGIFDPFVRMQAGTSEKGYNTSNSNVPFDEKTGSWTHDMRLNQVPVITINNIRYIEFQLDTNESSGNGDQYISLDDLRLYTSQTPGKNTKVLSQLGELRWDMDAGGDSVVLIDYSKASGSGVFDMTVYIPVSSLGNIDPTQYLYLYSNLGLKGDEGSGKNKKAWTTSDGIEEWGVNITDNTVFLPEPATLTLLGLGGLAVLRRRRAKN